MKNAYALYRLESARLRFAEQQKQKGEPQNGNTSNTTV
jgi:hypothetical protein